MHKRDNKISLGNPNLGENPAIFLLGEIILQQGLQFQIV